jgi:hypothetical protein
VNLLRALGAIFGDTVMPDPTHARNHVRLLIERALTLVVAILALGLIVGYQVLSRWGHLIFGDDD